MNKEENEKDERVPIAEELPDSWWYRVYLGVILTTILVIAALGTFSSYFSG
jgi:hypothetical protein